jgi:hypothetical protein
VLIAPRPDPLPCAPATLPYPPRPTRPKVTPAELQGFGFLVLDREADIARFKTASTPTEGPEDGYAATFVAPLVIVACSNKSAYLDRYAEPDKGFFDRSDAWWPAPYWDIDTGFAALLALLTAADHGLGACFFGVPKTRIAVVKDAFGIPTEFQPIGAIAIAASVGHLRRHDSAMRIATNAA